MNELSLPRAASARVRGRAHGEHFRTRIREIASIRTDLVLEQGRYADRSEVVDMARAHLPILEAFDAPLYDELIGIAEGSGLDAAAIVVLNHYTDLKDVPGASARDGASDDEDCSAIAVVSDEGPFIAQTWDMHGSVEPYVCIMHVPLQGDRPAATVFTITGCLALAGLNARGVAVCINNLKSRDARVGVVWPALVRRMLAEPDAVGAKRVLDGARMSSGHHYLFADRERVVSVETSGTRKDAVIDGAWADAIGPTGAYVHTNHCLSPRVGEVSWVGETSTTEARYAWLTESVGAAPIRSRRDAWTRLGSHDGYPGSVCTHLASPSAPHAMKTCGAVLLDPVRVEMWACHGCVHDAPPEVFKPEGLSAVARERDSKGHRA
ncbi:MAG: C45 family autoproteolytic acyltransferase/hydrolase [Sandaracinaceae bacterium]